MSHPPAASNSTTSAAATGGTGQAGRILPSALPSGPTTVSSGSTKVLVAITAPSGPGATTEPSGWRLPSTVPSGATTLSPCIVSALAYLSRNMRSVKPIVWSGGASSASAPLAPASPPPAAAPLASSGTASGPGGSRGALFSGSSHLGTQGKQQPTKRALRKYFSQMITTAGHQVITSTKFITMASAAKMPKAAMGITGETAVPKKAVAVVKEVLKTACAVRLYVKTMRVVRSRSPAARSAGLRGGSYALCRQPSQKTKMSSAPTPSTMKTARMCSWEKYGTLATVTYQKRAKGKERMIMSIPRQASAKAPVWNMMYDQTKRIDAITMLKSSSTSSLNSVEPHSPVE